MWISVHTSIDGPKLRDFRKKLGCSKFEATGILIYLWFWGLENAEKDGRILHADREDIEECVRGASAGCSTDTSRVVDALISTGWIDVDESGFSIHDWEIWQEQWYKAKERRENDSRRKRESRNRERNGRDDIESEAEQAVITPHKKPETGRRKAQDPEVQEEATASTEKARNTYSDSFIKLWAIYPRQQEKAAAYKKYLARLKDGYSEEELYAATEEYARQCQRNKTEQKYIKQAKTFFGENTPFLDYLPKKADMPEVPVSNTGNPFEEWS